MSVSCIIKVVGINRKQTFKEKIMTTRTIQKGTKEFASTPRAGWQNGEFFLISAGRKMKRVFSPQCENLPGFAGREAGCPPEARETLARRREALARDKQRKAEQEEENRARIRATWKAKADRKGPHEFVKCPLGSQFCRVCSAPAESHQW